VTKLGDLTVLGMDSDLDSAIFVFDLQDAIKK
jgi:hypothetical protein